MALPGLIGLYNFGLVGWPRAGILKPRPNPSLAHDDPYLNTRSSFAAEVMAVSKAIELVWVRDWQHIWLEVDSSLTLDFIKSLLLVPWKLHISWLNCSYLTSQMIFVFHIFSVKEIRWSMF